MPGRIRGGAKARRRRRLRARRRRADCERVVVVGDEGGVDRCWIDNKHGEYSVVDDIDNDNIDNIDNIDNNDNNDD